MKSESCYFLLTQEIWTSFRETTILLVFLVEYKRWVITAGHCLARVVPITVHFGLTPAGKFQKGIHVDERHQHIYPAFFFNGDAGVFDIGEGSGMPQS